MSHPQRHGKNLRAGRVSIPGQVYAITSVTHDRIGYFSDIRLARIVINALRFHHEKGNVESFAFVVMPDHLHWLVSLTDRIDLPRLMHSVKGHSARKIKGAIRGERPIWQEGYYDHALRREEDIRGFARYMILNPVRAGLLEDIWSYPFWDAVWVEDADFFL